MQVAGKVVVVTGGASGIGKALSEAFHHAGAAKVVVVDINPDGARAVATPINGAAFKCDVGQEKNILHVIEETEKMFGPIALFCSNAGIGGGFDPLSVNAGGTCDEPWSRSWAIRTSACVRRPVGRSKSGARSLSPHSGKLSRARTRKSAAGPRS